MTGSETADLTERGPRLPPGRARRPVLVGAMIVVAALAAAGIIFGMGRIVGARSAPTSPSDNGTSTALATVTRGTLTSQTNVSATIAYTGTYTVFNQAGGTITALPEVGRICRPGQILYEVNGSPVVLLHGPTPAHRTLQEGMSGKDVAELNADLVALGDATRAQLDPRSDYFSSATARALENLQANLGVDQTGMLTLGQAVFLPTAARITAVPATLGAPMQPGTPVLQATSTTRLVIVELDAALQAGVKVGDQATITLPDNSTTPGTVTTVGTVATDASSGSGSSTGSSGTPTVEVDITLDEPAATGNLDQAPVQVAITTARIDDAMIVPVDALLALAGGGYAVENLDGQGAHHLVPVSLGLFDDADGLVQVTGADLSVGLHVVVPST
jgi:hypothetical protein